MDPKKTGNIILEARKKLNITQKELADKLYVSDKAVSKWERGLCFPDISVLIPLTESLNISLYDLLRGEKMNKNEIEETLKDTIKYSNDELKRNKKKYITICSIIVGIILIISFAFLIIIKNSNNDLAKVVKKDAIYNINYYSRYFITNEDDKIKSSEKIESVLMRLPLNWKERTFSIREKEIELDYSVSYKDVVKAYSDEDYVNKAIINIASVIFTTSPNTESFIIKFTDYKYSIKKEVLLKKYNILSFDELREDEKWEDNISNKLDNDNKYVKDLFNLFVKNKVSQKELQKNIISD